MSGGLAYGLGWLAGLACAVFFLFGYSARGRVDNTGSLLPRKKLEPIVRTGEDEREIEEFEQLRRDDRYR